MGLTPFWGFQIILTLVVAHALGLSKIIAVIASNVSSPLTAPLIAYTSLVIGRRTTGDISPVSHWSTLEITPNDFWPWAIGSFILATITALLGALGTYALVMLTKSSKSESSKI